MLEADLNLVHLGHANLHLSLGHLNIHFGKFDDGTIDGLVGQEIG